MKIYMQGINGLRKKKFIGKTLHIHVHVLKKINMKHKQYMYVNVNSTMIVSQIKE